MSNASCSLMDQWIFGACVVVSRKVPNSSMRFMSPDDFVRRHKDGRIQVEPPKTGGANAASGRSLALDRPRI